MGRIKSFRSAGLWLVATALAATALFACASSEDDATARPKFNPVGPTGGSSGDYAGEGGEAGEWDPDSDPPSGGQAGDTSDPGGEELDPVPDPDAPEPEPEPAPAPVNAPGCGANGSACCASGDTCADNKAQCCTQCSGAPYYTCSCSTGYKAGGNCRVCCVVCNNGKVKPDPLYVAGSSCGDAAQAWCKTHFGVGADPKSGWRVKCG